MKPDPQHPETIVIKGVSPDSIAAARDALAEETEYDSTSGADNSFTLTMKPSVQASTKTAAVTQAIETIRNRIDELGVSEPVIQEHGLGENQILVQLPGVDRSGARERDHQVHRDAGTQAIFRRSLQERG